MIMDIRKKTEVSRQAYFELRKYFMGMLAFKEESGKYFIKVLVGMRYKNHILTIINKNPL